MRTWVSRASFNLLQQTGDSREPRKSVGPKDCPNSDHGVPETHMKEEGFTLA